MEDIMPEIVMIHDLKDPDDPQGRSYREVNAEKKHKFPVGALVEIRGGARLFIVKQTRDCDQTPLYSLCHDKEDTEQEREGMSNFDWVSGFSEDSLTLVSK
jgi:hypothetical protein